jgi:hypothetical protein
MSRYDLEPPTVADVTTPPPPHRDREDLIASLAEVSTDAATALSVLGDDAGELRNALVRVWKVADAAIRRARRV